MLRQDEAQWAENLEIVKREANEVKDEIAAFFLKQKRELQDMMDKKMSRFISCKPRYSLKKLPMWVPE